MTLRHSSVLGKNFKGTQRFTNQFMTGWELHLENEATSSHFTCIVQLKISIYLYPVLSAPCFGLRLLVWDTVLEKQQGWGSSLKCQQQILRPRELCFFVCIMCREGCETCMCCSSIHLITLMGLWDSGGIGQAVGLWCLLWCSTLQ